MPKKGKKGKKKKEEAVRDPIADAEAIAHERFEKEADTLLARTKQEEHAFNEFQQQREKLNYFWIVGKKHLEDRKTELRNKERELQDLEEKHQVEIKIWKQRLKHLLFEQQHEITGRKTEAEMALKLAKDDHRALQADQKNDRRDVQLELKEMELSHEDYMKCLKQEQDRNITSLRYEFERRAHEIQKNSETRMKRVREELEERRKSEAKALETRKDAHIEQLMQEHQKAFLDIKNYYNDITHNNLDLIKSLKEEVKELEGEEQNADKRLTDRMNENRRLSAPLKRMQEDVVQLREELEMYETEKRELRQLKAQLQVLGQEHHTLQWENDVLRQRFDQLKEERDNFFQRYVSNVYEVKQKASFQRLLLEKKVDALMRVQEQKEAQLNEVLARSNLEPSVLGQVRGRVDDVVARKDRELNTLQSDLDRITDRYDSMVTALQEKLQQYGIPPEELGFTPIGTQRLASTGTLRLPGADL